MISPGGARCTLALRMAAAALALAAAYGCMDDEVAGGTGVGNPPQGTATFAVVAAPEGPLAKRGAAGASSFTLADAGGLRFNVDRVKANLTWVRLRLPTGTECRSGTHPGCEKEDIRLDGPFVADLLEGTLVPSLGPFLAPAGSYRRIEARLDDLDEDEASPEPALAGHSVVVAGTFAYDGRSDRAFTFALDFNETLRFESGSMSVRQDALTHLRLRFAPDAWLDSVDIGRCLDQGALALDSRGDLHVDGGNGCEGLDKALREAFKSSGKMEERRPEDG